MVEMPDKSASSLRIAVVFVFALLALSLATLFFVGYAFVTHENRVLAEREAIVSAIHTLNEGLMADAVAADRDTVQLGLDQIGEIKAVLDQEFPPGKSTRVASEIREQVVAGVEQANEAVLYNEIRTQNAEFADKLDAVFAADLRLREEYLISKIDGAGKVAILFFNAGRGAPAALLGPVVRKMLLSDPYLTQPGIEVNVLAKVGKSPVSKLVTPQQYKDRNLKDMDVLEQTDINNPDALNDYQKAAEEVVSFLAPENGFARNIAVWIISDDSRKAPKDLKLPGVQVHVVHVVSNRKTFYASANRINITNWMKFIAKHRGTYHVIQAKLGEDSQYKLFESDSALRHLRRVTSF